MSFKDKNKEAEKVTKEEDQVNKPKITKDMLIGEVIQAKPETITTFLSIGMGCIACPSSLYESVEEAARVHGLDADYLIDLLNK